MYTAAAVLLRGLASTPTFEDESEGADFERAMETSVSQLSPKPGVNLNP
jgi:hypothetical protein